MGPKLEKRERESGRKKTLLDNIMVESNNNSSSNNNNTFIYPLALAVREGELETSRKGTKCHAIYIFEKKALLLFLLLEMPLHKRY